MLSVALEALEEPLTLLRSSHLQNGAHRGIKMQDDKTLHAKPPIHAFRCAHFTHFCWMSAVLHVP
jgi:hypothetical protein